MKTILNITGHLLLPNLSCAGVGRYITSLSLVVLAQKVGDKTKYGGSRVYVKVIMKCNEKRIQAR